MAGNNSQFRGHYAEKATSDALTKRELEVLELLMDGHSNESIGNQLEIRIDCVKKHVMNLMGKRQALSRLDLVVAELKTRHAADIKALRKKFEHFEMQSN